MAHIHNFSAGPCILPKEVMAEAAQAVVELNGSGLSLIEMSHRSKPFVAVMEEARDLVRELLNLPDRYEVLFLQGGASLGFLTAAHNLMRKGGSAAYVNTGTWSKKAIKEAKLLGDVRAIASSEDSNYNHIPSDISFPSDVDYIHITSNNTIFGTQWQSLPQTNAPLVCDMSSDMFSRAINVEDYALIYAGAQKNMGPAGTVLYIVDKEKLGFTERPIPSYLDLRVHLEKDSMFNTPPVFAVYTSMLMLRWIKANGGISGMQERAAARAKLMYAAIDSNPLFTGHANLDSRSQMNATFRLTDDSLAEEFDKRWNDAGISGLKGHRSVGGYRASMYNALPLESVETLTKIMNEFAAVNA